LGDNLVPMALGLPAARFVGVDLSPRQVEVAQRTIAALGLSNIEFREADIAAIDASWGEFDYVIAHGVYSWVPEPVRERLLALCNANLAANGVAYVSYNTNPGWRVHGMIRDMMIYHAQCRRRPGGSEGGARSGFSRREARPTRRTAQRSRARSTHCATN
jgi:tRNA/tmRNA/rRNA uracil-C5-methylase (TrmA/RlmC/RlmD family)